jgi:hypothetical protein
VVVRTFTQPVTDEQRDALLDALRDLCERPLDHPSVARPITCGLEGDTTYFVHAFLDGIPADEYLAANGPSRLADLVPLITPAAGALDFAAAAGVTHGALGFRDVIIGEHVAGISGFGLLQALQTAGIDIGHSVPGAETAASATRIDIRALATITSRLLVPEDALAMRPLVANPPQTALGFVAAMQDVMADVSRPLAEPASEPEPEPEPEAPQHREPAAAGDFDLRHSTIAPTFGATTDSILSASEDRASRRRSWIPFGIAASLAIGLMSGFAAGFVAGRREAPPTATESAPPPQPTATAGQIFTDQGVAKPSPPEPQVQVPGSQVPSAPVQDSRVPSSEASGVQGSRVPSSAETANRATQNQERGTRNRERGTANAERGIGVPPSLWIESRPTGAAVYVDGQLVGRTPLLLGGIVPGSHSVRLDMTGYQQWMTRVNVADSGRTRVAASLEQQ